MLARLPIAEALCALPAELGLAAPRWLVLYDAPDAARRIGEFTVFGNVLAPAG